MKGIILSLVIASSIATFGTENCYQVSPNGISWSRTPELLCVKKVNADSNDYQISLKSGMPFDQQVIATFNYSLLAAARCMDCNADVYGVANPSNSTFNSLGIRFDGKVNLENGEESGTVLIGDTKLYYRRNQ